MSTSWQPSQPAEPDEPQWAQPPFAPGYGEQPPDVVTGPVLPPGPMVPGQGSRAAVNVPPPNAGESLLRMLQAFIFPAMILGVIFTGRWWLIFIAIMISSVIGQVTRDMKRRRIARGQGWVAGQPPQDLR